MFEESLALAMADYDKYSKKMISEGKKPVSVLKYAFGNQ